MVLLQGTINYSTNYKTLGNSSIATPSPLVHHLLTTLMINNIEIHCFMLGSSPKNLSANIITSQTITHVMFAPLLPTNV